MLALLCLPRNYFCSDSTLSDLDSSSSSSWVLITLCLLPKRLTVRSVLHGVKLKTACTRKERKKERKKSFKTQVNRATAPLRGVDKRTIDLLLLDFCSSEASLEPTWSFSLRMSLSHYKQAEPNRQVTSAFSCLFFFPKSVCSFEKIVLWETKKLPEFKRKREETERVVYTLRLLEAFFNEICLIIAIEEGSVW